MLTKEQKKKIVDSLAEDLKDARSIVFSDFQGLATRDIQQLRAELRQEQVQHRVVKITLLKRALKKAGIDVSQFNFTVPLSVSWSKQDEIAPAKILYKLSKTNENLKLLGGVVNQRFVDAAEVKMLAVLPGRQELYAQIVGVIVAPLRGLVRVVAGNLQGLINVLSAKSKIIVEN